MFGIRAEPAEPPEATEPPEPPEPAEAPEPAEPPEPREPPEPPGPEEEHPSSTRVESAATAQRSRGNRLPICGMVFAANERVNRVLPSHLAGEGRVRVRAQLAAVSLRGEPGAAS